jgi:CRP-like cAMP-binding protein
VQKPLPARSNLMLARIPDVSYARFAPHLKLVDLPAGELSTGRHPNDLVYFPISGIVSLVSYTEDGGSAECAVVGHDSMVGMYSFVDGPAPLQLETLVQAPGEAYRIPGEVVRAEFESSSAFRAMMVRYLHATMVQMSQTTVCNRYHTIEQRICRWLLQCMDLVPEPGLTMTHKGMANMMGVHRERVTEALRTLEKKGLIRQSRGIVLITERDIVGDSACECYRVIKQRTAALLGETRATSRA